jgi:HAE1 family hydrophobic/amphiphilic exporter-1/multidrug efflux pump
MNISELSLRRPVLATVMSIVIVLFGYVGYTFLSLREYPAIDPPVVTVRTNYTGASADVIESQITEPLEKSINGIEGIKTITSASNAGSSTITVEFKLGATLDAAANDVRDKVSQAVRQLPQDIDAPPVVSKADANSDPIIIMAVQSRTKTLLELSDFAENVLSERLQTIPQVSTINIFGLRRYAMRIWLKPEKLSAYGLTGRDVQTALNRENVELPAGKVYGNNTELSIRAQGKLTTEQEFRDLIVRQDASGMVRLQDIADVLIGPDTEENSFRLNGASNCAIALVPQPGANYIEVANEFYKRLEEIKKTMSDKEGLELTIVADVTQNVRRSLQEVKETLFISFGLVVLVIYLFFRSWSIAIRPLIDIPISLIGTFFIMYLFGFSINVLTLLGIVLATGLVVDDGIVVTENIFRKLEQGKSIKDAALEGSTEIFFAVIATSLTLAVVFLPVIFLEGFVGRLFREFGIVVAGAVLISAFVSLTITPVLNVVLTRSTKKSRFYHFSEPFFVGMERGYRWILGGAMRFRWFAWAVVIGCAWVIYHYGNTLQTELAPLEDRSSVRLSFTAPEGTAFDYMDKYVDKVAMHIKDSLPEQQFIFASANNPFAGTGVNTGFGRVVLCPPEERKRSQQEVVNALNKMVAKFNEGRAFFIQEQTISVGLGGRNALPVQFVLQNQDFAKIKETLPKFVQACRESGVFQTVDANLKFNKPELVITVDRIKAKELGIAVADVSEMLQTVLSGRRASYFTMNGKQYQVIMQVDRANRDEPTDLNKVYVRSTKQQLPPFGGTEGGQGGALIPLSSIVKMEEQATPPALYHYNRYKSATVNAALVAGKTLGDGLKEMRKIGEKTLDPSFQTATAGPSRDFEESSANTYFALILALVLIYLLLAAQFESFIDPFIIMMTVPLALAGALLSLSVMEQTINIFSQIGMIMLVGLVTKNGILIVEFANQQLALGNTPTQAVIQAAVWRLRPILMTNLATALGALPIAISLGAAATSRIPLGIVLVGGILISLVLTLLVLPAIYTFFKKSPAPQRED